MRRIIALAILSIFILSTIGGYAATTADIDKPLASGEEKTKDRASRGMNNILYGTLETPDNINDTQTKGAKIDNCTEKTRSGVERGLARIGTGIWQLATFWYSDPDCVTSSGTSTPQPKKAKGKTSSIK